LEADVPIEDADRLQTIEVKLKVQICDPITPVTTDVLVMTNLDKNTGTAVDITGALDISTLFNLPPYCLITYSYTLDG